MNIKISWVNGWMEINAEGFIETATMAKYRKWAKLFAQYGETEQHNAFLQLVNTYIENQKTKCAELETALLEMQMKVDGRISTLLAPSYLKNQVKLIQGHLNGVNDKLKRYKNMYQTLEGLVS